MVCFDTTVRQMTNVSVTKISQPKNLGWKQV